MKPLTFDEIARAFENGEQLGWHPDYHFTGWCDGEAPLTLVHVSFLAEVEDKKTGNKQKQYFVGYRCSRKKCWRCEADNEISKIGPHYVLIKRNGQALLPRIEWIEYKKRTEMREHPNPVFVKYDKA